MNGVRFVTVESDKEQFIERSGLIWEQEGLPRIAGRTFALMLLSPDARSLDEIAEQLGVSKASVSNDARMLERMGFLERVSRPGDRRDYYQVARRSFDHAIADRIRRLEQVNELLKFGRTLAGDSQIVRERLENHCIAFSHVTSALKVALEAMRANQSALVSSSQETQ